MQIPSLVLSTIPAGACPAALSVTDQGATYCYLYATTPSFSNGAPQVCTGDLDDNSSYGKGIIDAYNAITH